MQSTTNAFDVSYSFYNDVVDPNGTINSIVTSENNRLLSKKRIIDDEYFTKERLDFINNSIAQRNRVYLQMVLVIIITLVVCIPIYFIRTLLPIFPDIAVNLLIIAIISCCIIYCIILYMNIIRRDPVDFQKINSNYLIDVNKMRADTANQSSIIWPDSYVPLCAGASCCPAGSVYLDGVCT